MKIILSEKYGKGLYYLKEGYKLKDNSTLIIYIRLYPFADPLLRVLFSFKDNKHHNTTFLVPHNVLPKTYFSDQKLTDKFHKAINYYIYHHFNQKEYICWLVGSKGI